MRSDALSEEFYYELAARVSDRMMDALPSEEALKQELSFSAAFEQKMEQFLANPNKARTQKHHVRRALAIAAVIIILAISALMSVSAIRQAVFKFFAEIYETYIVVMFLPEDNTITAPETILEFRAPDYIPPGYESDIVEKSELLHSINYLHADGLFLLYKQTIIDSVQHALDMENEEDKEFFEMNGTTAMYRIKHGLLEMIWTDQEYSYNITGLIEIEQALEMAHSVK